jgi:hypothetical protein
LEDLLRRDEAHHKAQNDMMGRMVNIMEMFQANQPGVQQPCGYRGFVQTNPPIFTGGKDPMAADHWLGTIEQKFSLI